MIKETLNREAVEQIFKQEAIYFCVGDAIPEYRVVELFGDHAAKYIEEQMKWDARWKDFGISGGGSDGHIIKYLYLPGFMKVVSEHNRLIVSEAHEKSEAGRIIDDIRRQILARIEREDAEAAARNEAKKQERKAKREAAKAAKEAAERENSGGEK